MLYAHNTASLSHFHPPPSPTQTLTHIYRGLGYTLICECACGVKPTAAPTNSTSERDVRAPRVSQAKRQRRDRAHTSTRRCRGVALEHRVLQDDVAPSGKVQGTTHPCGRPGQTRPRHCPSGVATEHTVRYGKVQPSVPMPVGHAQDGTTCPFARARTDGHSTPPKIECDCELDAAVTSMSDNPCQFRFHDTQKHRTPPNPT